jgi:hypothetical protein
MNSTIETLLSQYFEGTPFNKQQSAVIKKNNQKELEKQVRLLNHYPEPFERVTNLSFRLERPTFVSLMVYNLSFRCMIYLVCGFKQKGCYKIAFDTAKLPPGLYVARLRTSYGMVKSYMRKVSGSEDVSS